MGREMYRRPGCGAKGSPQPRGPLAAVTLHRGTVISVTCDISRPRYAGVFGGGGWFGIAFALGVLEGLKSHGIDLGRSPMLGTSAGSWAAAATATGMRFAAFDPSSRVRIPDPRPGSLHRAATELFGDHRAPNVSAVAVSLPTFSRVVLSGTTHPLADLVAASSALVPVFPAHRVGSTVYVDGGTRSAVSADLAADADLLVIIAPLAAPMFGPLGPYVKRRTDHGITAWQRRTGAPVLYYTPDKLSLAPIRAPHHLFDASRTKEVFTAAAALAAGPLQHIEPSDHRALR
jgi:predicted acylesterase/phospholipase RssA